jgi:CRP-like cAMP-binding protein
MYVVIQGTLRSMRQNAKGREQVLSTEQPGAVLAAVPIFSEGKFYATTVADTGCQVLSIDAQDILRLCQQHPELLWSFLKLFANKVRHYAELIETLALRNVNQRVAQHIYTLCQEQGLGHEETCTAEIRMTQSEMASRIGSTREVVCRALAHLESEQLIRMQGTRAVKIISVPQLAKFAGVHQELEEPRVVSEISTEIA